MCSGRVDMAHVLRAFSKGIDGVLIGGCRLGDCNYITHGNYYAQNMVLLLRKIMEHIGLNPERLNIEFMSGSEANVFVDAVNNFVRKVKEIGPFGQSEGIEAGELKARVEEVIKLVPYIKVEKNKKLRTPLLNLQDRESYFTGEEIDELLNEVVSYYIDPEKCRACMTCARRCPAEAIISAKNQIHIVDQEKCIKCGTCFEVCPPRFGAVTKISGGPVPPPLPEEERTIVRAGKG